MVQPPWKIIWRFLTKLNILLPCDLTVLLLSVYPKNPKSMSTQNLNTGGYSSFIHYHPNLGATKIARGR